MTERAGASGVSRPFEAGMCEPKRILKHLSKMVEATVQLWGRYHQGKRRNANGGVEEALRGAKGKCMAKGTESFLQ